MNKYFSLIIGCILLIVSLCIAENNVNEQIRDLDQDLGRVRTRVEENRDTLVRTEVEVATLKTHHHTDYEKRIHELETQLQQMQGVVALIKWVLGGIGALLLVLAGVVADTWLKRKHGIT